MFSATRHALLWSAVLVSLTACGGGEGGDVVDGLSVEAAAGGTRTAAALIPDWAASAPNGLAAPREHDESFADGHAFGRPSCGETGCEPTDGYYPQIDTQAMYEDRYADGPSAPSAEVSEADFASGRYAALDAGSSGGEGGVQ